MHGIAYRKITHVGLIRWKMVMVCQRGIRRILDNFIAAKADQEVGPLVCRCEVCFFASSNMLFKIKVKW